MAGWRDIHVGRENDRLRIDGVDIWQNEWRWIDGKTIYLPDPLDDARRQSFRICEVGPGRRPVRFAVGELPSGLWAFYVPV